MSKKGFTLVEVLLSLSITLLIVLNCSLLVKVLKISNQSKYIDTSLENAIFSLSNELITAKNIEYGDSLSFLDENDDSHKIILQNKRLVITPGHHILYHDIDSVYFENTNGIMKKKKNNGNVLQITLILLLMLSLNIFSLCHLTILNSQGFQSMKQTNDIRLLKNILIANYKYENQNSILLSNYLELENYTISYTVDDMGDYFLIETRLKNDRYKLNITFYLELDKEKNVIKKVE